MHGPFDESLGQSRRSSVGHYRRSYSQSGYASSARTVISACTRGRRARRPAQHGNQAGRVGVSRIFMD